MNSTTDTVTHEWMEATTNTNSMIQQGAYATASERLYQMCEQGVEVDKRQIMFISQCDGQYKQQFVETSKYNVLRDYVQSKGSVTREEWEAKLNEMNVL